MNAAFTEKILRIPIFRAGDYGQKGEYTPEDLQEIVDTYDPALLEAGATVDHVQDGPRFGVVTSVYSEGDLLYADMNVAPDFKQKLIDGYLANRSVEIYRSLREAGGRLYLKAVTFLGAGAPEVKGLPAISFSEDGEGREFAQFIGPIPLPAIPSPVGFEIPSVPMETGVLEHYGNCSEMLGHFHKYAMDADGRGFTSRPYNMDGTEMADGHVHMIQNGAIGPATMGGINHRHTYVEAPALGDTNKEEQMSDTKDKGAPVSFADSDEFKAFQKEREAFAADRAKFQEDRKALDAAVAAFNEDRLNKETEAAFSELFNAKEGPKLTEADKSGFAEIYRALDADKRKVFCDLLNARPAAVDLSEEGKSGSFGEDEADAADINQKRADFAHKLLNDGKAKTYSDALILACKEIK